MQTDTSLLRGLSLLRAVAAHPGGASAASLASELGLPLSSTYRLISQLETAGFLRKAGRTRIVPAPASVLMFQRIDYNGLLRDIARPVIADLSRRTGLTAHLGVLEDGMVTYLVRVAGRAQGGASFTREGGQLEAYCSAVGKVLLSALSDEQLDAYLKDGEFIALTANTLTDVEALRHEVEAVRKQGFAFDNFEVSEDLFCVSVPVGGGQELRQCAVSVSSNSRARIFENPSPLIEELRGAATEIAGRFGAA